MLRNTGGHLIVPFENPLEWFQLDVVMFLRVRINICTIANIRKIHSNTNHNSEENLVHAFKQANLLINEVSKACAVG